MACDLATLMARMCSTVHVNNWQILYIPSLHKHLPLWLRKVLSSSIVTVGAHRLASKNKAYLCNEKFHIPPCGFQLVSKFFIQNVPLFLSRRTRVIPPTFFIVGREFCWTSVVLSAFYSSNYVIKFKTFKKYFLNIYQFVSGFMLPNGSLWIVKDTNVVGWHLCRTSLVSCGHHWECEFAKCMRRIGVVQL